MPTETRAADVDAGGVASEVGRNIRAEMGRQRVSMVELGRRTRIPRSTLAHQIDISRVTVDNLVAIAAALNVSVAALLPTEQASA